MSIAPSAEATIAIGWDSTGTPLSATRSLSSMVSLSTNEAGVRPLFLTMTATVIPPPVEPGHFDGPALSEPGPWQLTARLEPLNLQRLRGEFVVESVSTDVEGVELSHLKLGSGAWQLDVKGPKLDHGESIGGEVLVRTNQPEQREISLHFRRSLRSLFEIEGALDLRGQARADWLNGRWSQRHYRAGEKGADVRTDPRPGAALIEAYPPGHLLGFPPGPVASTEPEGWTRLRDPVSSNESWVRSAEVVAEPAPGPIPETEPVPVTSRSELSLRRRDGQPFRILGWSWVDEPLPVTLTMPIDEEPASQHRLAVKIESWPDHVASTRIRIDTDHPDQRYAEVRVHVSP